MLVFLGSAIGDPEAPSVRRAGATRSRVRSATRGWCTAHAVALPRPRRRSSDVARAVRCSSAMYEDCRERDELAAAEALDGLAWVELRAGRWERAADYAERAYDLTTQYGLEVPWAHLSIAVVAAHRGQLELARAHSERALQLGEEQFGRHTPIHLGTLGFVALQSGDLAGGR